MDGVISAMQQAVNSPILCSYGNGDHPPPILEKKRKGLSKPGGSSFKSGF